MNNSPVVTILTPVYNGEDFLSECIESVLAQTYNDWEYFVVDNCSTDKTVEIARKYASMDPRIRVVTNYSFVNVIDSHNRAFRQIPTHSRYCKVVSADDWIYPRCIEKLVDFAERNPSVGVVQGCQISSEGVRQPKLPDGISLVSGTDAGRRLLLGAVEFTGPTALLYRSSLIRPKERFFPGQSLDGDAAGLMNCLEECDMGFVNEVLAFQRVHEKAETKKLIDYDSYWLNFVDLVRTHGPSFLTQVEIEARIEDLLRKYFHALSGRAVSFKGVEYWKFQNRLLREHGYRLFGFRLFRALFLKILELALNPRRTSQEFAKRFFPNHHGATRIFGQQPTGKIASRSKN